MYVARIASYMEAPRFLIYAYDRLPISLVGFFVLLLSTLLSNYLCLIPRFEIKQIFGKIFSIFEFLST